jgi:hypothetical protein
MQNNMNDLIYKLLGFVLAAWGFCIWIKPIQFSSRFGITFNFTEVRVPFALLLIGIGSFFIFYKSKGRK